MPIFSCDTGIFYPSLYSLIGKSLPVNDRSSGSAKASSGGPIGYVEHLTHVQY